MKRIIVASTQTPYNGGAATNSYALIKYFRRNGIKCAGIFFDDSSKLTDPDMIGGIFRVSSNYDTNIVKNLCSNYLDGYPEIILAKNYAAPVESKKIFKGIPVVYLVTGSPQMRDMAQRNISAQKYLSSNENIKFVPEQICINKSDYVFPNSLLCKQLLFKHYGQLSKIMEPLDTSFVTNNEMKEKKRFLSRKYDIAFVCSNLGRDVKNPDLANKIFSYYKNCNKILIGANSNIFKNINNTKVYGLVNNSKIMEILNDTKLLICTSYFDSSPNVIREALSCGANVLFSKNCGWSEEYPTEFVCQDIYDSKEWYDKAKFLIKNNIDFTFNRQENIIHKIERLLKK